MKKNLLLILLCLLVTLPHPLGIAGESRRGLFVSLIQNPPTLSSREEIVKLVGFAKRSHVKVLFVQIYRANKAWFPSKVGDTAAYDAVVRKLGRDPLALLILEAHAAGIEVHAWLNMLSLSENRDAPILKKYGSEILTRNLDDKKTIEDYKIDNQYFLEPGDTRVRKELSDMVGEVVRAYPQLDGVQFDYIRYPDSHPRYGYTKINVDRFKKATGLRTIQEGSVVWNDWKRAQVTELLTLLIRKARSIRPRIQVSATGCMSYARALHEAFQDWPSWVDRGLVDFVTVMNYSPDPAEYERWNAVARSKVRNPGKLYFGVGAYKFVRSPETFDREWRACEQSGTDLCAVFHYGSLLENGMLQKPLFGDE